MNTYGLARPTLFLVLLLGLGNAASAQTVTPCCSSEIKAFESQDASFPPPPGAVEIVGSSTIRLWGSVRNDLAPLDVIPRGFGGSSADDLDYYLDRIVLKYAPRAVAIYEGDTDTGNGQSAEYVAAKLQQIVTRIRTALPSTRVYIISVKPSPNRWSYWPVVQQLNQTMQEYCTSTLECTFIDVATALLDANGQLVPGYYDADRVHLSPAGYAVWTGVIGPALMAGEAGSIVLPQLQNADAGFAPTRGSLSSSDGFVDVTGSGVGTQGLLLDGFRYGYRQLTGNGQMTVRLTNQAGGYGRESARRRDDSRAADSGIPLRVRVLHARHRCRIHVPRRREHGPGRPYDATDHGRHPALAAPRAQVERRHRLPVRGREDVAAVRHLYVQQPHVESVHRCGGHQRCGWCDGISDVRQRLDLRDDGAACGPAVDIYPPYKPKSLVATALTADTGQLVVGVGR